jgi:hypothetical protein
MRCLRYFSGISAFDRHQRRDQEGNIRCLDPASVGLIAAGGWWKQPAPRAFGPVEAAPLAA